MLRGIVHDPTARRMGGVAGHAGLFSTAADLSIFSRMLLGGGVYQGTRILAPLTVQKMTTAATPDVERNVRGMGWDIDSSFSVNRGELLPVGSFGHTGFTGTSMWIDPATGLYVIFLSNRVHPDGKGDVTPLRARVATVAAASLTTLPDGLEGAALTGRDFGPSGVVPTPASSASAQRHRRHARRRVLGAAEQTRRAGHQPHGPRPRRRDHDRSDFQGEGRQAGRSVQPRARHQGRARCKRPVGHGREDRPADPFALWRNSAADRRQRSRASTSS